MIEYPDMTQPLASADVDAPATESLEERRDVMEPLNKLDDVASLLDAASRPCETTQAPNDCSAEEVDDDEVAQYMASLMERYGIRDDASASPAVTAPAPPPAGEMERQEPDESPCHCPPGKDWRPSRPPELSTDMGSLRELANASARSAVNVHRGSQIVGAAYTKLTLATVAVVSSAVCAFASPTMASPYFFVSAGAALASIYWGGQFWRLSGELHALVEAPARRPSGNGA